MKFGMNNLWKCCCIVGSFIVLFYACKKENKFDDTKVALSITNFYPNSGGGGALVTIEGEGFAPTLDDNTVSFGGVLGEVVSVDTSSLVVRAPRDGVTGPVSVSNGTESKEAGIFTYQDLSISRVYPPNGPAGAHISIYGEGFSSLTEPAKVKINGVEAIVASASDTVLIVEVPTDAGSGPIEVFVDGKSVRGQDFLFQAVHAIKPLTGGVGTKVRISGEGFSSTLVDNKVDFNGKVAKILEATANSLLVEAPKEVETGALAVTVNGQRAIGAVFTVVPFPELGEISPLSGSAGTEMTIQGKNFSTKIDENHVFINGKEIPVSEATPTGLKLTLPGGTGSGNIKVVVNDQAVEGPNFKDQKLGILDFTPDNGQDNLEVKITGTGFDTNPSANKVTFNGITAEVVTASENQLTVRTPANVSSGVLQVAVDGKVAVGPRDFHRSGIITIASGLTDPIRNMVVDASGNIFATSGNRILKITPHGNVSTFAGSTEGGSRTGTGTSARFEAPSRLVFDAQGDLFVYDENNTVWRVTPSGVVSSYLGGVIADHLLVIDNYLYFVYQGIMFRVPITNGPLTSIDNLFGSYDIPFYLAFGNIVYDKTSGKLIFKNIDLNANPTEELYGIDRLDYGDPYTDNITSNWIGRGLGHKDGVGTAASFGENAIKALLTEGNGKVQVIEDGNSLLIREVDIAKSEIKTLYKIPYANGMGKDGPFYKPSVGTNTSSFCKAPNGDIYFYEDYNGSNKSIRKIFFK